MTSVTLLAKPARGAWYMVWLLTLTQVLAYINRFLPSLLTPAIKADLHLTDFQIGLLLGPAFALFYVAVGLPFGWAADRYPRRGLLALGVAIWSAAMAAASLAFSFAPLFAARLGVGLGEAAVTPCAISLIGDQFTRPRRQAPISLYMSATFVGAGAAFLFGGPLVQWLESVPPLFAGMRPWQSAFLLAGLPGFLLAALMFSFIEPKRTDLTHTTADTLASALVYITARWRAFGALFVGSGCAVTLSVLSLWNAPLFQRTWGWPVASVGVATGLIFFTAGPLGTLAGVWLTKRWVAQGRTDATLRALLTGLAIGAPGLTLFPLAPTAPLAIGAMFIGFAGLSMSTAAGPASLVMLAPGQIRSQATAIYYFVVSLAGQVLGPPPVGWMADHVFGPAHLRYAMAIEAAAVSVPALILVALGLGAFRRRAEELEGASVAPADG
jgi:MFS family permease